MTVTELRLLVGVRSRAEALELVDLMACESCRSGCSGHILCSRAVEVREGVYEGSGSSSGRCDAVPVGVSDFWMRIFLCSSRPV